MALIQRNKFSPQVIKKKSDRLQKKIVREGKKKIKRGELVDSHDFNLFLRAVDGHYSSLKADINNLTLTQDYSKARTDMMAEAGGLLQFFPHDQRELERLGRIVHEKAVKADRVDDFKHEKLSIIDTTKLKEKFQSLSREEKTDDR